MWGQGRGLGCEATCILKKSRLGQVTQGEAHKSRENMRASLGHVGCGACYACTRCSMDVGGWRVLGEEEREVLVRESECLCSSMDSVAC